MKRTSALSILGLSALFAVTGAIALAGGQHDSKSPKTGADQQMQMPPGWTEADFAACMQAGTPGPMHEFLAESIGVWETECTMWMAPGAEPVKGIGTAVYSSMNDGRQIKVELTGDLPMMGPFNAFGIFAFDNVSEEFQAAWVCNCSTGIMNGTGELSSDGKTLNWTYSFNCPLTGKLATMREIERRTSKDTMTLTSYGPDPKTGKEYKMQVTKFTRKPGLTDASSAR